MKNVKKFFYIYGLFGVTAQKLDMEIIYIKTIIKPYVMNYNEMLRDAWNAPNAIYLIHIE
jgi:hypothetical protein